MNYINNALIKPIIFSTLFLSNASIYILSFSGNYYPEVGVFLSAIFFYIFSDIRDKYYLRSIADNVAILFYCIAFLFLMVIIGGVLHKNWINAYAEFRSLVAMVVAYFIFSGIIKNKDYFYLYNFCVISALINILMYFLGISFDDDASKYPSPIYFPAVGVIIACCLKDAKRVFFAFSLVCLLSSVSFFRQYWIVAFACFLMIIFNGRNIGLHKNATQTAVIFLFLAIIFIFAYNHFIYSIENNESLYIQSVGKTDDLFGYFSGNSVFTESDALRYDYFRFMFYRWYELILPHGLGSKGFYGDMSDWFSSYSIPENSLDSGLLFFLFHFGYMFFIPILIFLYCKVKNFLQYNGKIASLAIVLMIIVPALFDGGAIVVLPRAISIGLLLAILNLRTK